MSSRVQAVIKRSNTSGLLQFFREMVLVNGSVKRRLPIGLKSKRVLSWTLKQWCNHYWVFQQIFKISPIDTYHRFYWHTAIFLLRFQYEFHRIHIIMFNDFNSINYKRSGELISSYISIFFLCTVPHSHRFIKSNTWSENISKHWKLFTCLC